jgi:hypothetical protein
VLVEDEDRVLSIWSPFARHSFSVPSEAIFRAAMAARERAKEVCE